MREIKPTILILTDYYLPGFKAGGPLRSISNLVDRFREEFNFKIVTRDRDLGDSIPYSDIVSDTWHSLPNAEVYYCSPKKLSFIELYKIISSIKYDIVYLNSFFSFSFTIKPLLLRKIGLLSLKHLILAPRGEFSPGALSFKKCKKNTFMRLAGVFRLYSRIVWQASGQNELNDINNMLTIIQPRLPRQTVIAPVIILAPDLPTRSRTNSSNHNTKKPGELNAIFLSRISAIKNLDGALSLLRDIKGNVSLNIYGPIEDWRYWNKCKLLIDSLPMNISVQYMGVIEYNQVMDVLSNHHLFFFPTHGENFGHVIQESFVSGCPVLISDQTPWRNLADKTVGWDLPLNRQDLFVDTLQKCVDMDDRSFQRLSLSAKRFGAKNCIDQDVIISNRCLLTYHLNKLSI